MDRRKKDQNHCYGRLPASAPLANPYVPFQHEDPPKYEARKALVRGTLYPGLDLPFKGMVNKKEKPVTLLTELQTLQFSVQELALYLDTHRDDREALALYREYQKLLEHCKAEYLKKRGPLSHNQISDSHDFEWLNDPWPWEYAANKEV